MDVSVTFSTLRLLGDYPIIGVGVLLKHLLLKL